MSKEGRGGKEKRTRVPYQCFYRSSIEQKSEGNLRTLVLTGGGDRKWRCIVGTMQGEEGGEEEGSCRGGWYGFRQHLVQSVSLVRRAKHRSDSK